MNSNVQVADLLGNVITCLSLSLFHNAARKKPVHHYKSQVPYKKAEAISGIFVYYALYGFVVIEIRTKPNFQAKFYKWESEAMFK
jgi:hypothetical protein